MQALIVMPVRLASKRLPGKPLRLIGNEPLIRVAVRQIIELDLGIEVVVATDCSQVEDAVGATAPVIRTSEGLRNGTERMAAVARLKAFDSCELFINIQPDQLFVPKAAIIGAIGNTIGNAVGTAVTPLPDVEDLTDTSKVKAIMDGKTCVAFARTLAGRTSISKSIMLHWGIYVYRAPALERYAHHRPTITETSFNLEQVRALAVGLVCQAVRYTHPSPWLSINTEDDLRHAQLVYQRGVQ